MNCENCTKYDDCRTGSGLWWPCGAYVPKETNMEIKQCPHCGGRVNSISIGWKCTSCQGFIDMQGQFHEHKEEPFMPPMTNADRLRAMSDEGLQAFLWEVYRAGEADGYHSSFALEGFVWDLDWLRSPAEEEL